MSAAQTAIKAKALAYYAEAGPDDIKMRPLGSATERGAVLVAYNTAVTGAPHRAFIWLDGQALGPGDPGYSLQAAFQALDIGARLPGDALLAAKVVHQIRLAGVPVATLVDTVFDSEGTADGRKPEPPAASRVVDGFELRLWSSFTRKKKYRRYVLHIADGSYVVTLREQEEVAYKPGM
jgi:hypothetical protein